MKKCFFWGSTILVFILFVACFNEDEQSIRDYQATALLKSKNTPELMFNHNNSGWTPASRIEARLSKFENKVKVEIDLSALHKLFLNHGLIHNQDTFRYTIFYVQLFANGESLITNSIANGYYKLADDSLGVYHTSVLYLANDMIDKIELPFYCLRKFKAGSKVEFKVRIWQEFFLTEEIWKTKKVSGNDASTVKRDTLRQRLIDNSFTQFIKVPEVYCSDIICDSLILQNDKNWSPYGSDNTIWKSSLPDIYYAVADEYWHEQNSSHIEKSTSSFTMGDTLSYYYYSPDDKLQLAVYDHDNFSRDDALGIWKGAINSLVPRKRYMLKFGHVSRFYLQRIDFGKQN